MSRKAGGGGQAVSELEGADPAENTAGGRPRVPGSGPGQGRAG